MAIVTDLDAVNRTVIETMQRVYGDRLAKIILYGSYARGDYHDESDVDYLVVLYDEHVSAFSEVATTRPVLNKAFSDTSIYVSTVVVSNEQLTMSVKPFFKEVRKDGRAVYE